MKRWLRILMMAGVAGIVGALLLVGGIDFRRTTPRAEADTRPNIIIVVIETLRADHLRAYGYARHTMPNLEDVAREGVLFENASTVAPWTYPSVSALLTGLPPSALNVTQYDDMLPLKAETLAERLKRSGYSTAFVGVNSIFEAKRNLEQGFDHFDGTDEISAEELNTRLLSFLHGVEGDKPVFLYAHYFDPHCRYTPPQDYHELYWPPPKALETGRRMTLEQYGSMHECFQLVNASGEGVLDVDYYLAEYDAELRHTDHLVGLFLERLKTAGLFDNTLLMVLADHGEEFWDHGGFGHGKVLYEESTHVPLVIRLPHGAHGGRRVEERVSTLDLAPTALSVAGLPMDARLPGVSLQGLLEERDLSLEERPIYAETDYEGRQRALWWGPFKLLVSPDGSRPHGLFHLPSDPLEQNDLSESDTETRNRLFEALLKHEAWLKEVRQELPRSSQRPSDDVEEALKRLGYLR